MKQIYLSVIFSICIFFTQTITIQAEYHEPSLPVKVQQAINKISPGYVVSIHKIYKNDQAFYEVVIQKGSIINIYLIDLDGNSKLIFKGPRD